MENGKLSEHHLENAVFREFKRFDDRLEYGPGIGSDYSVISDITITEGSGNEPYIAWNKGLNNYLCSLGSPLGARIVMLLPAETKQTQLKEFMKQFTELSELYEIQITGGETKVLPGLVKPEFVVSFAGNKSSFSQDKKRVRAGTDIVFIGNAGCLATNILVSEKREELAKRFDGMYLENAMFDRNLFSINISLKEIVNSSKKTESHIYCIHDVSTGGAYAALWQLGKLTGHGFMVDNRKIPVRQATIELCDFFDINPYMSDSTGCVLVLCSNGYSLADTLKKNGINANVIGQISEGKERLVKLSENDIRTLSPMNGDDLYKIINE